MNKRSTFVIKIINRIFNMQKIFMKKSLFLILLLFSCFCYGQTINDRGQKLVKRIELLYGDDTIPYVYMDFFYNNCLSLKGIFFKSPKRKINWFMKDNKLIRMEFDENGNIDKRHLYTYGFNDENHITLMTMINKRVDKSLFKFINDFHYDEYGRLSVINKKVFYSSYGEPLYELSNGYKTYYKVDENGNLKFRKYIGENKEDANSQVRWESPIYSNNMMDDTNLNLTYLLWNRCRTDYFEMYTEWINVHSEYLPNSICSYNYKYIYKNNNISQIVVYNGGRICERYKLYYL